MARPATATAISTARAVMMLSHRDWRRRALSGVWCAMAAVMRARLIGAATRRERESHASIETRATPAAMAPGLDPSMVAAVVVTAAARMPMMAGAGGRRWPDWGVRPMTVCLPVGVIRRFGLVRVPG